MGALPFTYGVLKVSGPLKGQVANYIEIVTDEIKVELSGVSSTSTNFQSLQSRSQPQSTYDFRGFQSDFRVAPETMGSWKVVAVELSDRALRALGCFPFSFPLSLYNPNIIPRYTLSYYSSFHVLFRYPYITPRQVRVFLPVWDQGPGLQPPDSYQVPSNLKLADCAFPL